MIKPSLLIHILLFYQFLTVFSLVKINEKSFLIVQMSNIGSFPNETLEVVLYKPNVNVTGRVVYLDPPLSASMASVEPFRRKIDTFAQNGCLGVITARSNPGQLSSLPFSMDRNFPIPVAVLTYNAPTYLKSLGNIANFTFLQWDPNSYDNLCAGPGYMAIVGTLTFFYLVNFIYASFLIVRWIKTHGIDMNIGIICLILECSGNFIRVIEMILYPYHPNFYSLPGMDIVLTIPVCISLVSSIVIVFFWLDLTSDPFYHGKFLGAMKIPAIIFIGILVVVEIVFDILRNVESTANQTSYLNIIIAFFSVVHLCVVVFNFIAANRILKRLNETKEKENYTLSNLIYRIIYSGVVTVFGMLFLLGMLLNQINAVPLGSVLMWWFCLFTYALQSFLLISVFQVPEQKKDRTSSSKKELTITS